VGSRPAERPASHCRREEVMLVLRLKLIVAIIAYGELGEKRWRTDPLRPFEDVFVAVFISKGRLA
jgi:hypothetical protein